MELNTAGGSNLDIIIFFLIFDWIPFISLTTRITVKSFDYISDNFYNISLGHTHNKAVTQKRDAFWPIDDIPIGTAVIK